MWGIIWLGFSTVFRWLNSVIQENPFRLYFQGQAKRCFLAGQRRVKQVQDPCRRRHTVFLTASSCNRDKIAGNLIRFVPLDFLKDERQCQTLKTITSCLYKQPLVSLDINQSLGHLLSMPIGLAPALSPGSHGRWRGQEWDISFSKNNLPILPLVAFRIHLVYGLSKFACFGSFSGIL